MEWASNLFVALLLMDITGTIFFLFGQLFYRVWFEHNVRWLRIGVAVILATYGIPIVYAGLYVKAWIHASFKGTPKDSFFNLYYSTETTLRTFQVLGCIWSAMFLGLLAYRLYRRHCWAQVCKGNIPEEDHEVEELFGKIAADLGLQGKVSLYRNDLIEVPCVTYYHGLIVILPLVRYTKEETGIILYHELCHHLEKDVAFKTMGIVISLLHVFNPAVHILLKEMELLCEESCDRLACQRGAGLFSQQRYFQVILDMIAEATPRDRYQLFALFDTKSNYERRILCMMKSCQNGGLKKGTALVLATCFLLGSSITSMAAGNGITDAYLQVAEQTDERNDDVAIDEVDRQAMLELARQYDLDPDTITMVGEEGIEPIGNVVNFAWRIPAGRTYMSTGFNRVEGDTVIITSTANPDDITYQIGIKDPEQLMRYCEGTGKLTHEFEIKMDGRYYFFVTNMDEEREIEVEGVLIK